MCKTISKTVKCDMCFEPLEIEMLSGASISSGRTVQTSIQEELPPELRVHGSVELLLSETLWTSAGTNCSHTLTTRTIDDMSDIGSKPPDDLMHTGDS